MDVASEPVLITEDFCRADELSHSVVGGTDDRRTQEESFDVVPAVESDDEVGEFTRREGCPRQVVASAVDAAGAVEGAVVGEEDSEQRDAPSVVRPAVTDAAKRRVANRSSSPPVSAGGAGNVVFLAASARIDSLLAASILFVPSPVSC